jgi:hypothetical protein
VPEHLERPAHPGGRRGVDAEQLRDGAWAHDHERPGGGPTGRQVLRGQPAGECGEVAAGTADVGAGSQQHGSSSGGTQAPQVSVAAAPGILPAVCTLTQQTS